VATGDCRQHAHGFAQIDVTELARSTYYGDCRTQHTFVFFIGQAFGPVVYRFDLRGAGITPALLAGTLFCRSPIGSACRASTSAA